MPTDEAAAETPGGHHDRWILRDRFGNEIDETDRPLSKRVIADLLQTKLAAKDAAGVPVPSTPCVPSTPSKGPATRAVVAAKRHAYDEHGILKGNVVSIKSLQHADDASRATVEVVEAACGISFFVSEEDELNIAGDEEDEYVLIEIALDSGAGDHVAAALDAPGYTVEASAGSRRGQNFVGAGGHRMANKGQVTLHLMAPNGVGDGEEKISTVFQVADVTRPLWSVSKVCDAGYDVRFSKKQATILDEHGQPVCVFERQGGLYVARMRLRNPKYRGFSRRGQ